MSLALMLLATMSSVALPPPSPPTASTAARIAISKAARLRKRLSASCLGLLLVNLGDQLGGVVRIHSSLPVFGAAGCQIFRRQVETPLIGLCRTRRRCRGGSRYEQGMIMKLAAPRRPPRPPASPPPPPPPRRRHAEADRRHLGRSILGRSVRPVSPAFRRRPAAPVARAWSSRPAIRAQRDRDLPRPLDHPHRLAAGADRDHRQQLVQPRPPRARTRVSIAPRIRGSREAAQGGQYTGLLLSSAGAGARRPYEARRSAQPGRRRLGQGPGGDHDGRLRSRPALVVGSRRQGLRRSRRARRRRARSAAGQ